MTPHIDFTQSASRHNPFVLPEGYLAGVTTCIMQRISRMEQPDGRNMRIVRWIPLCGAAAVAALFVVFAAFTRADEPGASLATGRQEAITTATHEYAEADYTYDYFMTDGTIAVLDYNSNE